MSNKFDFARAVRDFVDAFGTPPPAEVYALHPAHGSLTKALRQATAIRFRAHKQFQGAWCDEVATHCLRDLLMCRGQLTSEGLTAAEIREYLASLGPPLNPQDCNRATALVSLALIDDEPPPLPGPLREAWEAVRSCPPPDYSAMRKDAPSWGQYHE